MSTRTILPAILVAGILFAQDWTTVTTLNGVDFTGLTPAQQTTVLKLLRERPCGCGCEMKVAECRVKDPGCSFSRGLAAIVVNAIKQGKTPKIALAEAEASRFAHPPKQDDRVLGDPVALNLKDAPVMGPANARITLVEFSDFQCPYCIEAVGQLNSILKAYPTQVKLAFKQFPLDIHSQAALASAAAIAAHKQGKFWPMHDALFARKGHLNREVILQAADEIKLDRKRFEADLNSAETKAAIQREVREGDEAGVQGTPTIFINGRIYRGAIRAEALKPILDEQLKAKP